MSASHDTRHFAARWLLPLGLGLVYGCGGGGAEHDGTERDARQVTLATSDVAAVVESNDAFAWSLYARARTEPGNLFFSPFSISAALAMTLQGARGQTADEIRRVLHVTGDEAAYHRAFGALLADLGGEHPGRGYELFIANALFGQTGFPFDAGLLADSAANYGAPLMTVDFAETEAARSTIDGWVKDQTHGALPRLLESAAINANTVLVLANGISFDGVWTTGFDPSQTQPGDFWLADGTTVSVPMMHVRSRFRHFERSDVTAVELPYQDDEVSMVLLLPQSGTLTDLEASLPLADLFSSLDQQSESSLDVDLPRLEMTRELPLRELLLELGMPSAFDETLADLSGMVEPGTVGDALFIQDAVHQGHVLVDERGTRAEAATAVVVGTRSATPGVRFDHPYLFLIRDRLTDSILFMGRVVDPLQD